MAGWQEGFSKTRHDTRIREEPNGVPAEITRANTQSVSTASVLYRFDHFQT